MHLLLLYVIIGYNHKANANTPMSLLLLCVCASHEDASLMRTILYSYVCIYSFCIFRILVSHARFVIRWTVCLPYLSYPRTSLSLALCSIYPCTIYTSYQGRISM